MWFYISKYSQLYLHNAFIQLCLEWKWIKNHVWMFQTCLVMVAYACIVELLAYVSCTVYDTCYHSLFLCTWFAAFIRLIAFSLNDKICTASCTYIHVLSLCCLYPLPLTWRFTKENFQKIPFLMQFITHNFAPKRNELRYHCCLSQLYFIGH
jgi:hypothetical protein